MSEPRNRSTIGQRIQITAVGCLLAFGVSAQQTHADHEHGGELRHHTAHHRFEDAESWSRQFDNPERDIWQKPQEVVALMELEEGMTVADIGAGTGYFLGPLAAAVGATGSVLGLDVEASMVDFMTERAEREGWSHVTARRVQPNDPGLGAGTTDRVLIVNTWHHIADRGAYAARLLDGLKPGGRVYVVDFTLETSHGPPPSQRLMPETVIEELEAGGLAASIVEETLPEQYIVVGRKP